MNVSLAPANFNCKAGSQYYFQFTINSDATRAWYAMLLTAATNKTPVYVAFPGACEPNVNQPIQYIYQTY